MWVQGKALQNQSNSTILAQMGRCPWTPPRDDPLEPKTEWGPKRSFFQDRAIISDTGPSWNPECRATADDQAIVFPQTITTPEPRKSLRYKPRAIPDAPNSGRR